MGNDISSNYNDIKPLFTIGYWDVKKAKHKTTGEKVSLWSFDYPKIKAKERNTNARHQYMEMLMVSIRAAQKINHPNVLKIREYTDNMKQLAFAAEPIKYQIANNPEITRDEAIYASKQLAGVMKYLNEELHFAYLSICPETIVFSKNFQLKLALFPFTRLVKDPALPLEKVIPWEGNTLHQMAAYAPPELVHHMDITIKADPFMYGLFVYYLFTNENMLSATDATNYRTEEISQKIGNIPEEYGDLIKPCLNETASVRPSFSIINGDEAFSSTVCDVFGYLDSVDTKSEKEIFDFLTGLSDIVHVFSARIKENYFLPIFKKLILKDFRYGIIIIPIILTICEVLSKEKISKKIMVPLAPVFEKPNNPQLVKIILQNSQFIIDNIASNQLPTYIYPSIFFALNSNNEEITLLGIDKVKLISDHLSGQELAATVLPEIVKALPNAKEPKIATIILSSIESLTAKVDHDTLVQQLVPAVAIVWKKNMWPTIAEEFFKILRSVSLKHETLLKFTVPLSSEILANKSLDTDVQRHYFDYCINAFIVIMKDRGITSSISSPEISNALTSSYVHEAQPANTDPFAARAKKKQNNIVQNTETESTSFQASSAQNNSNPAFSPLNSRSDPFGSTHKPEQSFDGLSFADSPTSTGTSSQAPHQNGGFEFPSQQQQPAAATSFSPFNSPAKQPANNDFTFPSQQQQPAATGFAFPSNTQQNNTQNQDNGFSFSPQRSPSQTSFGGIKQMSGSSSTHNLFSNDIQNSQQNDNQSGLGLSRPMRPSSSAHDLFASTDPQPMDRSNNSSTNNFGGFGNQQPPQNQNAFGAFGAQQQQPSQSNDSGLDPFGAPSSPQPNRNSGAFGGFGNQQQQPQQNQNAFGGFNSQEQQPPKSQGFDPFGAPSSPQPNRNSGAFDAFGGQSQQQPNRNSGSFGQQPPSSNDPFGGSSQPQQNNQPSDPFGGSQQQPSDPFGGSQQQPSDPFAGFSFD